MNGGIRKRNKLKQFVHIERIKNEEFVKKKINENRGPSRRGSPLGRWKDRIKEYMHKTQMASTNKEGG